MCCATPDRFNVGLALLYEVPGRPQIRFRLAVIKTECNWWQIRTCCHREVLQQQQDRTCVQGFQPEKHHGKNLLDLRNYSI
jgi:hypothetical protein